mgnify:CR=1 FL=1
MQFELTITGMDELLKKVGDTPALIGEPLRNFFTRSALLLQRDTQVATPVDTGRLRASINFQVDPAPIPGWARVGTNVYYGVYVEEDTRPHFPPVQALAGWAGRHGLNPYLVARAISRRGTKGRHMFRQSAEKNQGNILALLGQAANEIETNWSR